MTLDDFPDALPLPQYHEDRPEIECTSQEIPDKDGHTYTVTRFPDNHYECRNELGEPDIRRVLHGHCHHVRGMMLAWENIDLAKPAKLSKKLITLKEFITGRKQHRNSMIAWHDDEFQQHLGDTLREVLELVFMNPGLTRNDYVRMRGGVWNHTAPRLTDLKNLELVYEEGAVKGPSGQPRARLYPAELVVYDIKGA
jgi:hypothetical protein